MIEEHLRLLCLPQHLQHPPILRVPSHTIFLPYRIQVLSLYTTYGITAGVGLCKACQIVVVSFVFWLVLVWVVRYYVKAAM